MKPITFHPSAEAEFASSIAFYQAERSSLAVEFAEALNQAVIFVQANPEAGTQIRGPIRRWLVRRFPYSIIYREEESQRSSYWPWPTSTADLSIGAVADDPKPLN